MILLIAGIALWWGAHLFKRLAPAARSRLGEPGKGLVALALVASVVLMVYGYRGAAFVPLWSPPAFLVHLNNLLMVLAVYLFVASSADPAHVRVAKKVRHPQLTGFKTWCVAHLLVNGDAASVLLFGGLLAWSVVSVIVINRGGSAAPATTSKPIRSELALVGISLVVFAGVAILHAWLGRWPFPG